MLNPHWLTHFLTGHLHLGPFTHLALPPLPEAAARWFCPLRTAVLMGFKVEERLLGACLSAWLTHISLRVMPSGSSHAVTNGRPSSFCCGWTIFLCVCVCVCVCPLFFIQTPISGRSGCVCALLIEMMLRWTRGACIFSSWCSHFLQINTPKWNCGLCGAVFLTSEGPPRTVFHGGCTSSLRRAIKRTDL